LNFKNGALHIIINSLYGSFKLDIVSNDGAKINLIWLLYNPLNQGLHFNQLFLID